MHDLADDLLRLVTYNIMDGAGDRWEKQVDLLAGIEPDILGLQEAKHWDRNDHERMCATANWLGMQWHLARSGSHGCHLALLWRWPKVQCLKINPDFADRKFHHTATRAQVQVLGVRDPFTVLHTHLAPFGGDQRLAESGWLTEYAAEDRRAILLGDLNTPGLFDKDREYWHTFPPHLQSRHRLMLPDGTYGGSDRRAMATLIQAGWIDPYTRLKQPAHRTAGYWGPDPGEHWDHRSDFTLLSRAIAPALDSQTVIDAPEVQKLADHLPVVTCLRIGSL